jgi:hypothetical protein
MSDEAAPAIKVRIDWFLADVFAVEIDVTDEAQAQMVVHAEMFLRCGNTLSWDKWSLLSESSRAAFLKASENVRAAV